MKLLLICLFVYFCAFSVSEVCGKVYKYRFGDDVGDILNSQSGSVSLLEYRKKVGVIIPECAELTFVEVIVENVLNAPEAVKFDWDSKSVTIEYDLLEYTPSDYTIASKGYLSPWCKSN